MLWSKKYQTLRESNLEEKISIKCRLILLNLFLKKLKKLAQSDKFLLNKIFVQILTFDHISRMIWEEMMRVEVVGMP